MSQKQISQWRSVGFAFLVLALLSTVLLLVVLRDKASPEAVTMFGSLCTSAWIATLAAFGKSLGEKAADGAGLKGIARVLMTDTKPGGPPATPPAAGFVSLWGLLGMSAVAVVAISAVVMQASIFWGLVVGAILASLPCFWVAILAAADAEGRGGALLAWTSLAGCLLLGGGVLAAIGRGVVALARAVRGWLMLFVLALATAALSACDADQARAALGIRPAAAMVPPGAALQLVALGAPPPVTWSVLEAGGGTVAGGLYQAPACPTTGTFHVQVSAGGQSAQAAITVAEAVLSITVTPATVALQPGQSQQFSAQVRSTCGTTTVQQTVTAQVRQAR